jgi:hypothetical protein
MRLEIDSRQPERAIVLRQGIAGMIAKQQDAGFGPPVDSLNRFELIRGLRLCHDKTSKIRRGRSQPSLSSDFAALGRIFWQNFGMIGGAKKISLAPLGPSPLILARCDASGPPLGLCCDIVFALDYLRSDEPFTS